MGRRDRRPGPAILRTAGRGFDLLGGLESRFLPTIAAIRAMVPVLLLRAHGCKQWTTPATGQHHHVAHAPADIFLFCGSNETRGTRWAMALDVADVQSLVPGETPAHHAVKVCCGAPFHYQTIRGGKRFQNGIVLAASAHPTIYVPIVGDVFAWQAEYQEVR